MCHTVYMTSSAFRLPHRFLLDADSRCIVDADIGHRTTQFLWVAMTDGQLAALDADAIHHSDPINEPDPEMRLAAQACLRHMHRGPSSVPKPTGRPKFVCPTCNEPQSMRPTQWPCFPCRDDGVAMIGRAS